ncbi:hypothetical protein BJF90_39450 [Pseudonocardia sp. CNS-004]|nr:hypothetical protein BJF90_39450 [Pseudonocardia sp. CNS-004]
MAAGLTAIALVTAMAAGLTAMAARFGDGAVAGRADELRAVAGPLAARRRRVTGLPRGRCAAPATTPAARPRSPAPARRRSRCPS